MLGPAVAEFDLGAHGGEQLALGLDVADLGNVFEDDFVFGEDGGSHAGESGVLGAGDFDGAEEGIASANDKLVHLVSLRGCGGKVGAFTRPFGASPRASGLFACSGFSSEFPMNFCSDSRSASFPMATASRTALTPQGCDMIAAIPLS